MADPLSGRTTVKESSLTPPKSDTGNLFGTEFANATSLPRKNTGVPILRDGFIPIARRARGEITPRFVKNCASIAAPSLEYVCCKDFPAAIWAISTPLQILYKRAFYIQAGKFPLHSYAVSRTHGLFPVGKAERNLFHLAIRRPL